MMDAGQIYEEFQPKVRAYVRDKIHDPHDTKDLVSAVFMKVVQKLDNFDPAKASVSTWVYTITRNTDNVTINEEKDLAKDGYNCTQKMPADGITVAAKFVNKTFKTTIKLIDKDGNDITAENLIEVKVADGKYVAVKTGTVIETVFNNNVNISLTSTGKDYKITG